MKPSKEHYEKAFKIIEWSILVLLILASLVYVKDVWIKYQSNDTSRKVSRKVSQFLDNPAITLWYGPFMRLTFMGLTNVIETVVVHFRFQKFALFNKSGQKKPEEYSTAQHLHLK